MKRIKLLFLFGFLGLSAPAIANDELAAESDDLDWTIGVSGGVTSLEGADDQFFTSISVTKDVGDSYVGLAVSYIDSGAVQGLIGSIPASTAEITLSAGTSFDALNIDGYLSYGIRNFDTESFSRNGQTIAISSDGESFGAGASISYDLAVSSQTFVSPIASVDYSKLGIARATTLPNGDLVAVESKEDGVSGTAGLAVQILFGPDDTHLLSFIGNAVTTSNTTAFNPGNSRYPVLRALATREEPGQSDSWAEIGGSISLGLSERTRLDLSIIRTLGFLDSDITSISTGLRFSF